jgi:AcrR family transcriptional regulator
MSSNQTMPRQARALRTRQRLLESGRRAFASLGHDGVNLARDILAPAGVSVGSFYHQFDDKTDLLLTVLSEAADDRRAAVLGLGFDTEGDRVEEGLSAGFVRFFDSLDTEEHAWAIQLRERAGGDDRVREIIREGREHWVDELADLLGRWTDANEEDRRKVAIALLAFATGLATYYLDLPPALRATQRPYLLESATSFATHGVVGALGGVGPDE